MNHPEGDMFCCWVHWLLPSAPRGEAEQLEETGIISAEQKTEREERGKKNLLIYPGHFP